MKTTTALPLDGFGDTTLLTIHHFLQTGLAAGVLAAVLFWGMPALSEWVARDVAGRVLLLLLWAPMHLLIEFDRKPAAILVILGIVILIALGLAYWYDRRRFRWAGIGAASMVGCGILFSIFINVVKPALAGTLTWSHVLRLGALPALLLGHLIGEWRANRR